MKAIGVAGAGSVVAAGPALAQSNPPASPGPVKATLPLRAYGRTGVKVPILALGGIFDISTNQLVLQRALDLGVTYWDTANGYVNGNSEKGIGQFFERNPDVRQRIFLVTKAGGAHTADKLDAVLAVSLERMKTDYVDLFFLHGLRDGSDLTSEIRAWSEKAKAANKIRFIGFSTHSNMEASLQAAARAGWVDGIMLKYDFRLMHTDTMRAAVDACEKAGIGLTAMKTQAKGTFNLENEADLKLGGHFVKRGFTEQQAKLKAVWENPQIASICSQMPNVTILSANVAAALDRTRLSAADQAVLREYAEATCARYCDGCVQRCEPALEHQVPVGDLMRGLMYHRQYGDVALARSVLGQLPVAVRERLASLDYTAAERVCPNRLPIGRLMREAGELLA
jgi:predicted aldo/keto reductase-like oxidoreductase